MSTWLSIGGWVCVAITIVGFVLSVMVWRRRGASSGMRGIAWSLIPLAAYLTHSIGLIGRIVSAIVQFASSFVFSPKAWLGVVLLGIAVLLFMASGGIPLVRGRKDRKAVKAGKGGASGNGQVAVRGGSKQSAAASPDAELGSDVQEILRRHGIK